MTNFDKFKTYCRKFCVQTRLAVRISLSITAITTFATQAAAQNNPQEIRLDFNDAALSQVLKSIETQSRYTFFYNNDIDVTQSVSAHIASSDINSVVTAVLKGGVTPQTIRSVRSPAKSPTRPGCRWSA